MNGRENVTIQRALQARHAGGLVGLRDRIPERAVIGVGKRLPQEPQGRFEAPRLLRERLERERRPRRLHRVQREQYAGAERAGQSGRQADVHHLASPRESGSDPG